MVDSDASSVIGGSLEVSAGEQSTGEQPTSFLVNCEHLLMFAGWDSLGGGSVIVDT